MKQICTALDADILKLKCIINMKKHHSIKYQVASSLQSKQADKQQPFKKNKSVFFCFPKSILILHSKSSTSIFLKEKGDKNDHLIIKRQGKNLEIMSDYFPMSSLSTYIILVGPKIFL